MFQVILIFNGEGNSSVIRWTDPSIAVDGQHNASFHLCNNKFHKVVVRRNFSNVEFQVDEHAAVRGTVPAGFSLQHGTFYIGGVPGNTTNSPFTLNVDFLLFCPALILELKGALSWIFNISLNSQNIHLCPRETYK